MLYLHGTLLAVGEVERPLVVFDPALDLGRGEVESLLLGPGDEVPLERRVECPCDLVPGGVGKGGKRRLCRPLPAYDHSKPDGLWHHRSSLGSSGAAFPFSLTRKIQDQPDATTTALTSSFNPSVFGQSVTFTATVAANAPGAGTPTGTVTFYDGSTALGSGTLAVVDGTDQATYTTATLSVGSHNITAVYAGDSNFDGSSSAALGQTVSQDPTATSLTSSVSPSVYGQSVTFTATVTANAPGAGTPTGTVTFYDGSNALGSGTLDGSGVATFTTAALSVGSHSITADYSGDSNFDGSVSAALGQAVNQDPTTTALTSSFSPSVYGQSVTFTATVAASAPGAGTPTGTVTFYDGSTLLGSASLNGADQAAFSTTTLSIGSHSITAAYSGDGSFGGSASTVLSQAVNQDATSTTVSSSVTSSVYGQPVTLTAAVSASAPGAGTPTGAVTFYAGSTILGKATLNGSGVATLTTGALPAGTDAVTAAYAGDSNFLTSTSSALTQTVQPAATATTVVGLSVSSAVYGQPVVLTATVSNTQTSAAPAGTVTFLDGSTILGAVRVGAGGSASLTVSALAVGKHSLTASFSDPAGNFAASSSPKAVSLTVSKASTATTLTATASSTVFSQSVTFTATVMAAAPSGATPTGNVTFKDGTTTLATVALSNGSASFTTTKLAVGNHSITVTFGGTANFVGSSSSAESVTVSQDGTTITVSSSVPNPVFGQSVKFTAKVAAAAPGTATPTGTVTFMDGATVLGTATLSNGVATLNTSALPVGTDSITAVYNCSVDFITSTSAVLALTVGQDPTTTSLTSSSKSSTFGQLVTFTATVKPVAPGSGTPTGTVSFYDGTTLLGTVSLTNGVAAFSTSTLARGKHSIKAVYSSDADFLSSTSSVLTQTVS
jgi:hypothetical protein